MVLASKSCNSTCPVSSWSVIFTILVASSSLSPSFKNLGMAGCTIKSFCVTISFWDNAIASSRVWAKAWNFQRVTDSGILKLNSMVPFLSVLSCGKKKAVSLKLRRGTTLVSFKLGASSLVSNTATVSGEGEFAVTDTTISASCNDTLLATTP